MAMNKSGMADEILNELEKVIPTIRKTTSKPYWEAISEGIIKHIKENMEILTDVTVENVTPGTGTITTAYGEENTIS